MGLAVEGVLSEEKGSAEEDDAGDEPADEKDGDHNLLILATVSHTLDQLKISGGQLLLRGLADHLAALVGD